MTRELVYGRRPVREALRGPREVLELWAGERAVRSEAWLREVEQAPAEVAQLAEQRREARDAKDFAGADRLRDEIAAAGWEVRDVAEPPGYRLVRRS